MNIKFIEPSGAVKQIGTEDELLKILEIRDDGYWSYGSGSASIKAEINNKPHSITLTKKKNFGFMIHHFFDDEGGFKYLAQHPEVV